MTPEQLQTKLIELDACEDARKFCEGKTLKQAWDECTKSDWMLWLMVNTKTNATDKQLRLIAVKCAREVQHLMTDPRSINALNVAERFANGEATENELGAAWYAARDAARAAARDAARDAARAAAWAAARAAARDAAWAAAWYAAWAAQCKIIREFIPQIEIL